MDTVRVDIAYRPLRIAWAVHSEDRAALDKAVRLTHATWGGRFNPIVLVDQPEEAKQLIEVFRADVICPIGDCEEVKNFPDKYPYLIDPFYGEVFRKTGLGEGQAQVLDIQNAIAHWHGTPMWKVLEDRGIRAFKWDEDDPLAWPFLMQLGAYPKPDEIGIDYAQILASATMALYEGIDKSQPIPEAVLDHPSIGSLTRHGLMRHHAVPGRWEYHGFFVGNASNVFDLVSFWNLRAADMALQFIDLEHLARYTKIIPHYIELLTLRLAHLRDHQRRTAVWGRPEVLEQAQSALSGRELTICPLGPGVWNGLNVEAPMMILGEETSLGVLNRERKKPRVSFAMKDKPFNGGPWFYTPRLVASVSMIGGLLGDDHFTYRAPYVPELNEFFARTMHFKYDAIRVDPGRIGIVIDAADHDAFLEALPTAELIERVFNMAKVRAKLSSSGLIARQLLGRLGGVSNARVFKVPGARRLLKTFGPNDTFTRSGALQLIGKKDPDNPQASFKDHEDLYIERREDGSKLTPAMVFAYLTEKGLFRIGFDLTCPICRLRCWVSLDDVKQRVVCELCGASHDATRQLIDSDLRYRRTGVLGLEKNTQGAVPVALVLEQLTRNVSGAFMQGIYGPSYDLEPMEGKTPPKCETDFVMIIPERYPKRTSIIIGECKDGTDIDHKDVENLREVADAFPRERFRVFITLVKLSAFTPVEIELAKSLNDKYRQRAILLSASELEPYGIYDRANEEFKERFFGTSAQELAAATAAMYFSQPSESAGMA